MQGKGPCTSCGAHLRVFVLHDIENGPPRNIGHHHPQLCLMNKGAVEGQHVGMVLLPHCLCFSYYFLLQQQLLC